MKPTDIKNKSVDELRNMLSDLKTKMAKLSFELEANTLKDSSQIRKAKRDIARILTVINGQNGNSK